MAKSLGKESKPHLLCAAKCLKEIFPARQTFRIFFPCSEKRMKYDQQDESY